MLKMISATVLVLSMGTTGAAWAGPCAAQDQAKGSASSAVDPASTAKTTPGAKAESPGTVGAMNNAGGGSFTSDGKPTQQAGVTAGPNSGC